MEFKDFLSLASEIPDDMPQRLVARQLHNLFTLRHNVEIFKETIAVMLANRRIGDQLGTLMAGCHSLYSTKRLDLKQCEKYLNTVNLDEFLQVKSEREDVSLLHHMVGSMIRVETVHGTQDRTIGELMVICFRNDEHADVNLKVSEATLARYGMKIDRDGKSVHGVWIGQSIQSMNRIMQTSVYYEGWAGVLMRHPYAKKSANSISFGGTSARAIHLPTYSKTLAAIQSKDRAEETIPARAFATAVLSRQTPLEPTPKKELSREFEDEAPLARRFLL